jgi:nucleoside-diphosphate-sugar epimerase
MNKNILICGASGFMGRNIANRFLKDDNFAVYGVGNSRTTSNSNDYKTFFNCDLTTKIGIDAVFKRGINYDVVIQAAATTSGAKDIIERPYLHVTDNAVMNSLILQACYDNSVGHLLFLSCGVMYNPDRSPVAEKDHYLDEDMPKNYFGVGWTKIYVEKMCEFFSSLGRTKHTVIRHSNTYGPYDKYDLEKSHMFGATITKVLNASDGDEIIVWGDGTTERDLLYVDDVVDFIHLAIKNQDKAYDLFNVGMGKSFSVNEIVNKIIEHSGKKLTTKHDLDKPSINTKLAFNSDKALNELGWSPKYSLDDGVKKTIVWYNKNIKGE